MNPTIKERIEFWKSSIFDDATKQEILKLESEPEENLIDAFYKDLEFGTGGMRGIMGAGTNRINKYTLGRATQGLGLYLKQQFSTMIKLR